MKVTLPGYVVPDVEIESCNDCRHCQEYHHPNFGFEYCYCREDSECRELSKNYKDCDTIDIPDWCPLSEENKAKAVKEAAEREEASRLEYIAEKKREEEHLKAFESLKEKIGSRIYWACKGWSTDPKTIEAHIISDLKHEIYKGDFYREFDGKKVIKIFVEDGGFYLYDYVGKSLFFTREEAEKSLKDEGDNAVNEYTE